SPTTITSTAGYACRRAERIACRAPAQSRCGISSLSFGRRYLSGSSCRYGREGRFTKQASPVPTLRTPWKAPGGICSNARSWMPKNNVLTRPKVRVLAGVVERDLHRPRRGKETVVLLEMDDPSAH